MLRLRLDRMPRSAVRRRGRMVFRGLNGRAPRGSPASFTLSALAPLLNAYLGLADSAQAKVFQRFAPLA
jgi:hypothetical protein